jgi:serine/threonine protein kinase
MKVLSKSLNQIDLILNEIEALKIIKSSPHKNIIKVYDIFENSNNIYIIMENLKHDFNSFLKVHNKLSYEEKIKIVNEICEGISFLHSKRIVHRDIKLANILIELDTNNQPIVKLIDFGLSKFLYHNEKAIESLGTLVYTAPEVLQKKCYDFQADVWSFGVVLYYIFKNRLPFKGKDVDYVVNMILNDNSPVQNLIKTNKSMDLLISKCLEKDQTKRFNINNILDFIEVVSKNSIVVHNK